MPRPSMWVWNAAYRATSLLAASAKLRTRPSEKKAVSLAPTAERRRRQPAADDLAQAGEVGADGQALLRTAVRDAEPGDHLVQHEQRAGAVADRAQPLEEPGLRGHHAHVAGHRLDDHAGQVVAMHL